MRNMKRQIYPNSEYCNCNLIIIYVILVIVSWIFVHKQGISGHSFIEVSLYLFLWMNTIYLNCYFGWIWCFNYENGEWKSRTNRELEEMSKGESIVKWIKGQKISWLGHLERMEEDRLPKKIFTQELEGTRRRGRPRKRWKEEVERDLQVLGVRRWRELVAGRKKMERHCSTGQSPQWAVVSKEEEEEWYLNPPVTCHIHTTIVICVLLSCANGKIKCWCINRGRSDGGCM